MQGLLADVNVQGHVAYLRRLIDTLGLGIVLTELNLRFAVFSDLELSLDLDDRTLWNRCQQHGWVLLTDNRNHDDLSSLEAVLADSWHAGKLPVLTISNKARFERDLDYAIQVANDVAELLFGIAHGEYLDLPRIYVPL